MAQLKLDGTVTWKRPENQLGTVDSKPDEGKFLLASQRSLLTCLVQCAALLAALGIAIASAVSNSANYDDILAIVQRDIKDASLLPTRLVDRAKPSRFHIRVATRALKDSQDQH